MRRNEEGDGFQFVFMGTDLCIESASLVLIFHMACNDGETVCIVCQTNT